MKKKEFHSPRCPP